MIFIGKAPYRISLLGGGSDLDWFVNEEQYGLALGYSLNMYSYSVLNQLPRNSKFVSKLWGIIKFIVDADTRDKIKIVKN